MAGIEQVRVVKDDRWSTRLDSPKRIWLRHDHPRRTTERLCHSRWRNIIEHRVTSYYVISSHSNCFHVA